MTATECPRCDWPVGDLVTTAEKERDAARADVERLTEQVAAEWRCKEVWRKAAESAEAALSVVVSQLAQHEEGNVDADRAIATIRAAAAGSGSPQAAPPESPPSTEGNDSEPVRPPAAGLDAKVIENGDEVRVEVGITMNDGHPRYAFDFDCRRNGCVQIRCGVTDPPESMHICSPVELRDALNLAIAAAESLGMEL